MIAFNPQISVEVGSVVSIVCSFLSLFTVYCIYIKTKKILSEMGNSIEKLIVAFTQITNALMGEENETKYDDGSNDSNSSSPDPSISRLWDSRAAKALPEDN